MNQSLQNNKKVLVAMSGGIDSAVAAGLLKDSGYSVLGIHFLMWKYREEDDSILKEWEAVQQNASVLEIPVIRFDLREKFEEFIHTYFCFEYGAGRTPNPCILCNPHIKWNALLDEASRRDISWVATGHYSILQRDQNGRVHLLQGMDGKKDQSYVLSMLAQKQLVASLMPLGDFTKDQVRDYARMYQLPAVEREESQDLCFLPHDNYRDFLSVQCPNIFQPGFIKDVEGNILGEHQGLPRYTIGQRKGIRISNAEAYYVVRKDVSTNTLIVGTRNQAGIFSADVTQVNWIVETPKNPTFQADVMIRYRSEKIPVQVTIKENSMVQLAFFEPVFDLTPGQFAVFYHQREVLGAGFIQ